MDPTGYSILSGSILDLFSHPRVSAKAATTAISTFQFGAPSLEFIFVAILCLRAWSSLLSKGTSEVKKARDLLSDEFKKTQSIKEAHDAFLTKAFSRIQYDLPLFCVALRNLSRAVKEDSPAGYQLKLGKFFHTFDGLMSMKLLPRFFETCAVFLLELGCKSSQKRGDLKSYQQIRHAIQLYRAEVTSPDERELYKDELSYQIDSYDEDHEEDDEEEEEEEDPPRPIRLPRKVTRVTPTQRSDAGADEDIPRRARTTTTSGATPRRSFRRLLEDEDGVEELLTHRVASSKKRLSSDRLHEWQTPAALPRGDVNPVVPGFFPSVSQNAYPNPFGPQATIKFGEQVVVIRKGGESKTFPVSVQARDFVTIQNDTQLHYIRFHSRSIDNSPIYSVMPPIEDVGFLLGEKGVNLVQLIRDQFFYNQQLQVTYPFPNQMMIPQFPPLPQMPFGPRGLRFPGRRRGRNRYGYGMPPPPQPYQPLGFPPTPAPQLPPQTYQQPPGYPQPTQVYPPLQAYPPPQAYPQPPMAPTPSPIFSMSQPAPAPWATPTSQSNHQQPF